MTATWRWAATLALTCTATCGGRVLADDLPVSGCSAAGGGAGAQEDGGASGGHTGHDSGLDASTGGFQFALDGGLPWDALPMPEGGLVSDCLTCVRDNCRDPIDRCVRDEACLVAAACVALGCPDPNNSMCPRQCAERDLSATLESAMALACVLEQCQQSCPTMSLGAMGPTRLGSSGAGSGG
ncbi:MAG: hypothetical protein JW940_17455 [Polyangiaceae bacterium]|nr:hypothetical protein [Polyangiaceae bacterium]